MGAARIGVGIWLALSAALFLAVSMSGITFSDAVVSEALLSLGVFLLTLPVVVPILLFGATGVSGLAVSVPVVAIEFIAGLVLIASSD